MQSNPSFKKSAGHKKRRIGRLPFCQFDRREWMERIKHLSRSVFFILLAFLIIASCSGAQIQKEETTGVYHRVKKGETAYSIARVYNIKLRDLAHVNDIPDPALIKEGTVLFIPGAKHLIEDVMIYVKDMDAKAKSRPIEKIEPKPAEKSPKEEIQSGGKIFIWPVNGTVKTRFGRQPNKTYHNWIKVVLAAGISVKAAAAGTVIFSSNLKDYGQTIIIRHEDQFTTVYTHLKERFVKADQAVKQGQAIALVGEKDESGAAYINFEIRINGKASNPLLFLP